MPKRKSIAHREYAIAASSSSSDIDDHKSLGTNQEQALKVQASTHDAGLSRAM
jgi:hypothetical protein